MALRLGVGRQAASLLSVTRRTIFRSHGFGFLPLHSPIPRIHNLPESRFSVRATTVDAVAPKKEENEDKSSKNWKIKMLYDGECPLCMREVMGNIHAISSDGTVVKDIEAFRKLYEAVDLGWVYAITKYEPIATIADAVYGVWAKYRLQITGRPPLEEVLEARRKKEELCKDSKSCKM